MPFIRPTHLLVLTLLAACGGEDGVWRPVPDASGPGVAIVDSVLLHDPDSLQLGGFTSFFARSSDGQVFIVDGQRKKVFHFDGTGGFQGTIGSPGSGPGEFDLPGVAVVLPGDSLLIVDDVNRRGFQVFGTKDHKVRRQVKGASQDVGSNWAFSGDSALFALHMSPQLIGHWRFDENSASGAGTLPPRLAASPSALMRHGRTDLVRTDSGLAAFFPTEGGISLLDSAGQERAIVRVPAARRLGEPAGLREKMERVGPGQGRTKVTASSADGIHRLADGSILLAHLDMEREATSGTSGRFGRFRLYLSVLRADLSAACVDGLAPVTSDVGPIPIFRGDTIYVLARQVQSNDDVRTVLYSLVLDTSGCTWLPTGGVLPPSPPS